MNDATIDSPAALAMTQGGDARIVLDPATGLNRYLSAPYPRDLLAYASSTANDVSEQGFARAEAVLKELGGELGPAEYATRLDRMRARIRATYRLPDDVAVVFAASGTDLEYVALACVPGSVHSVLLGADEVGTGCIHSAHGRYFAESTALGVPTAAGDPVPGLDGTEVDLVDVPVRDADGRARPSEEIAAGMAESIAGGRASGRHALIHVVHGSKTGLILPGLDDIDRLRDAHGGALTIAVDACQARITAEAIGDYLERGAIVFVTGSKFMGGPPFSGFALVPPALAESPPALPEGLATIFRRAEWPEGWPGRDLLPDSANLGLLLRLEASIVELERFQAIDPDIVRRVILAFHGAVRAAFVGGLGARRVAPYPPGDRSVAEGHPVEMRTLSTLDLSRIGGHSFEDAQGWHKALVGHHVRLGQPVKCVRLPDGRWGATLRVGLTMAQIVDRASLDDNALNAAFKADMERIAAALRAVMERS